jgi:hypothetical protein
MTYENKVEWNKAKREAWEAICPARQKLTKQLSTKGAKLFSTHVGLDNQERKTATLQSWTVTSLSKTKKARHIGLIKKIRSVNLFIDKDESKVEWKETSRLEGNEGDEVFNEDSEEFYSTPEKALSYAIKRNLFDLKWSTSRPIESPDDSFLDEMFSTERYDQDKLALSRLKKRLSK